MKPRILIIDTYYPDFLKSLPFDPDSTYEAELRKVLDRCFGTADFYSRNLKALGWDAVDVLYNHADLQQMWAEEHYSGQGRRGEPILNLQFEFYKPDVIFLQDLSIPIGVGLELVAGQCSCPMPSPADVAKCHLIFSSFPHYVPRIEALGVRAVYNPLAFEPSVLERSDWKAVVEMAKTDRIDRERIHDVVFIGGVGNPSHWRYGMEVLETVAREIPTFKWWGYGLSTLPADSALRRCYQGEAWGLQMYEILLQSKICLNRHGEVAEGYANNMRMFEATGCGALLFTEKAPNLKDFFTANEATTYTSANDAVEKIRFLLDNLGIIEHVALNGQQRTLRDHTYAQRMKTVSETLTEMLCPT